MGLTVDSLDSEGDLTQESGNVKLADNNIEIGNVVSPTDTTANNGGLTLKGTTDKTFTWLSAIGAWISSEDMNLITGKVYKINNSSVLSSTVLGPTVVSSSLTSVGTLTNLTVTNPISGSITGNASTVTTNANLSGDVTFSGNTISYNNTVPSTKGGMGVSNSGTITVSGNTVIGSTTNTVSLATTANTSVTLPTSGTLATTGNLSQFASTTSAQLAGVISDETGTGFLVFATSPTLTTPLLGTPTSGILTNCTGLPISTGVSGLGSGVATFLSTPSSANLAAAITDETGTGALIFGTTPTITTPVLNGTPTGTGVATTAIASTLALRDSNGNLFSNNLGRGYTSTATAAGTTTLTVASTYNQFFTGTTTQTITLPVVSTLTQGFPFFIKNLSTGNITINSSGGNQVVVLTSGKSAALTCIAASGTTAASWDYTLSFDSTETTSATTNTTSSTSDALLTNSVSGTPAAGTYLVYFSCSMGNNGTTGARTFVNLYKGPSGSTTKVANTERSVQNGSGWQGASVIGGAAFQTVQTFNGTDIYEIRWRVSGGTATIYDRTLTLLRIG